MSKITKLYKLSDQIPKKANQIYNFFNKKDGIAVAQEKRIEFLEACIAAPTVFWCPNGKQEEFIKEFSHIILSEENDTNIGTLINTFANGVGKTELIIQLLMNLIHGKQNGWFDYKIFDKWPIPKTIWYCSTPNMLANKIVPLILKYSKSIRTLPMKIAERELTEDLYIGYENEMNQKKGSKWVQRIEFGNGWMINFWSYGQDPKDLEGDEVGLIINDEPAPESFNKAQKSRRRMGNITIHIMTPLYCDPYLVNDYKQAKQADTKGIVALEASVYDACQVRGIRGHLNPKTIDKMIEEYDEDEREARAFGRFMFYSTRIYPTFNSSRHVVEPLMDGEIGFWYHGKKIVVPPDSIIKYANDPKDGAADAVVYGYLFPSGRKYIFAETPVNNEQFYWKMKTAVTVRNKLLEWINLEKTKGIKVDRRIIDKIFAMEQTRGSTKIVDIYEKEARKLRDEIDDQSINFLFWASHGNADNKGMVKYRHNMVNEALAIQPDGMPNLLISSKCIHSIRGMEHYIRKHNIQQLENIMEVDSPPVPKFKDFPDAIGFFVCDGTMTKKIKKLTYNKSDGNWAKGLY